MYNRHWININKNKQTVEVPEFNDAHVYNDMIFLEDEKLDDSIDDDDCFDEQIYLTNFCFFKLFSLFLWKKTQYFQT